MLEDPPSFRKQLFGQLEGVAKAFSNKYRLEIIDYLAQSERTVEQIAQLIGTSISNTSQHLSVLKTAGLVETRTKGHYVVYSLAGLEVLAIYSAMEKLAEKQSNKVQQLVDTFLTSKNSLSSVSMDELEQMQQTGDVILIDVRPEDEFVSGHIPGSFNMPLETLREQLDQLPTDKTIVAYCRGPLCILAFEAVAILRAKGLETRRLENGFSQWLVGSNESLSSLLQ